MVHSSSVYGNVVTPGGTGLQGDDAEGEAGSDADALGTVP